MNDEANIFPLSSRNATNCVRPALTSSTSLGATCLNFLALVR